MTENEKKKLLYRANYRGFKEADIMLGGFLKAHINELSDIELRQFEVLLEERDHDIYAWITQSLAVPEIHDTPLLAQIRQYRPTF